MGMITVTITTTMVTDTIMIITAMTITDRTPTTIITDINTLKVKSAPPAAIPMRRTRL